MNVTTAAVNTPLLVSLCVSLAVGNFVYQGFASHQWAVAAERSFFQVWALGVFYLISALWSVTR